jgi:hypothetical protein
MTRVLAVAALALAAALGAAGAASADDCYYSSGGVNICPSAQECSGTVSVCPMAHPDDCQSNVDVCLDFVGPKR